MLKPMTIEVSTTGPQRDISVVSLKGQLDSITSSQLEKILDSLVDRKIYRIIVDMEHVTYVSSAGWGIFLGILKDIRTNRGDLKLSGISADVMEVIRMLEIDSFLPTYASLADAVSAFS